MSPFDFLRFKRHNLGGAPDILQFRPKIPLFTVKTAIVGSNSNTSRTSGEREMEDGGAPKMASILRRLWSCIGFLA